ncbi:MAG TPA: hypothetical protein VEO01_30755 [Pseudonocardiaceae bacterium]|nr:hypothetical protein [Pseudonocardiaceae bacterium]
MYVTAEHASALLLIANGTAIGAWEEFDSSTTEEPPTHDWSTLWDEAKRLY